MQSDKELYRRLRALSREQLWNEEVPRFNRAAAREREQNVAVIRAVGVAFAGSGTPQQRTDVLAWLIRLLQDPSEKVRRYAIAALPKLGAGRQGERELLALLKRTDLDRERKFVGRALDKLGGRATLAAISSEPGVLPQTEQKVKASVARMEQPSVIRMDRPLADFRNLRINLRCRVGLQGILREEIEEYIAAGHEYQILDVRPGYVTVTPLATFSLDDLFGLRCFATVGFVLGSVSERDPGKCIEALATMISSPESRRVLEAFTEGPIRYRIEFVSRGHQRGAVHQLASRVYAMCPELLNDSRRAPWSIDIHSSAGGTTAELRPRLSPDPRLYYRLDDIAAASHPPLAAAMARLAGNVGDEIVWDPFCGSGLELIERSLRGGVRKVFGTDLSPEAIQIARANFAAAHLESVQSKFACVDFREFAKVEGLRPKTVTLMISNPPMGRRIRIKDMRGLFADLFRVAATVLKPGGRLVFPNPLRLEPGDPSLRLEYHQFVDLGGFECRLEMWRRG
jgi:predicted RNA methylase